MPLSGGTRQRPPPWHVLLASLAAFAPDAARGSDVEADNTRAFQSTCLIGDRGEDRAVLPGFSGDSLCCAMVEVYMARRSNGYCPELQELEAAMPFTMRCTVDDHLKGAYVPDVQTAHAAAQGLCDVDGCAAAASTVAAASPALGTAPRCGAIEQDEDDNMQEQLLLRLALALFIALSTMGCLVVFHSMVTPLCMSVLAPSPQALQAAAGESQTAQPPACALGLADVAVKIPSRASLASSEPASADGPQCVHVAEVSPPPPPPRGPPPPGGPSPVEIGHRICGKGVVAVPAVDGVRTVTPNDGAALLDENIVCADTSWGLVAALPAKTFDVEDLALAKLATARAQCRAHTFLMCGLGVVSILVRIVLVGVTITSWSPNPLAAVVLILCAWQLAVLARPSLLPFPARPEKGNLLEDGFEEQEVGKCGACAAWFIGPQAFVLSTATSELLVLASVMVGSQPHQDNDVDAHSHDSETLTPFSHFLLNQGVVSLVLVRLYIAWLAWSLQKQREELTRAVLPAAPESLLDDVVKVPRGFRTAGKGPRSPSKDQLVDVCSELDSDRLRARIQQARRRVICGSFGAFLLVLLAAFAGIWRAHTAAQNGDETSSCRTAARGLNFCVPMDYFGLGQEVATYQECCALCDRTTGCQAWSFVEHAGGSGRGTCERIRFSDPPCSDKPSHFSCRCHTGIDRIGGYSLSHGDSS